MNFVNQTLGGNLNMSGEFNQDDLLKDMGKYAIYYTSKLPQISYRCY